MAASSDHSYRLAVLVLLALGSLSVASQIARRWFPGSQRVFLAVYAATLALVAAWAVPLVAQASVFGNEPMRWLAGLLVGVPLGLSALWADRLILRTLIPARRRRRPSVRQPSADPSHGYQVRSTGWIPGEAASKADRPARAALTDFTALPTGAATVVLLLVVGALEEVVYRGDLARLSLNLRYMLLAGVCLTATVVFFGLLHASFGWRHAVAKTSLGALALLGALGTGTVLCAVSVHLVFNAGVLAESHRQAVRRGDAAP